MYLKYIIAIIIRKTAHFLPSESKLRDFLNFFLVFLIGSNHPRRIMNLRKIIKNQKLYDYEKINFTNFYFLKKNCKKICVFIGDSHSDYYGRNFTNNNDVKTLFLACHTGPTLMTSFATSPKILKEIYRFIKFTKYFYLTKKISINIVFSYGAIDVRNFFYQSLKLDKNFKNENYLINFIIKHFFESFQQLKAMLKKKKINNINFFFKDLTPEIANEGITLGANKKYYKPKNLKELENIRKKNPFPIIGSLKERVNWRNQLSKKIKYKCKKNGIKFLNLEKDNFGKNGAINKMKTLDNVHINDIDLIQKVQYQIF